MSEESVWVSMRGETRNMTEAQIKKLGMKFILKRRGKYWVSLFIISMAWFFIIRTFMTSGAVNTVLSITPFILCVIAFIHSAQKAGKWLWEYVHGKEQPVKFNF